MVNFHGGNDSTLWGYKIFRATPQQLERVKGLCDILERKIMATNNSTPHNYIYGSVVSPSLPQPTRVMPQQLEEKREKGLWYNCDSKCTKGHKCAKKKLFYIEYEEEEEKDQETSKEEDIHEEAKQVAWYDILRAHALFS